MPLQYKLLKPLQPSVLYTVAMYVPPLTEQLTKRCEPSKYFLSWKGTPSGASNFGLDGGTEKKLYFLTNHPL
jgi:hypothetical protein